MAYTDYSKEALQKRLEIWDQIEQGYVGKVTSRDQFIDPYSVVDPSFYSNTRKGQAQYNSDLQRAQLYLQQQQAAYQEWYESPEQQSIRQREAGINPDLAGLSDSESAPVALNPTSPISGQETNGQVASRVVDNITGVVSTLANVASLATAFQKLPSELSILGKQGDLLDSQLAGQNLTNEALDISNSSALGLQMANDIGDLLGTAMQAHLDSGSSDPFDLDGFFKNDENFASLQAVYGSNPRYASLLAKQKKAVLEHQKKAVNLQKDVAQGHLDFGQVASSPFLSPSQKLTILQIRPFTDACIKADQAEANLRKVIADWESSVRSGMSTEKAIDAANAQFDTTVSQSQYQTEYYDSINGSLVAGFEQFLRDIQTTSGTLEQTINQGYLDLYNSDPTGVGSWQAAYLYGSNGGSSWNDAFMVRNEDKFNRLIESEIAVAEASGDTARLQAFIKAIDGIMLLNEYRTPSVDFIHCVKRTRIKIDEAIKVLESFE